MMSSSSKVRKLDSGNGVNQACQGSCDVNQQKKKVRRRLHTSRPYQERLVNMAEARREIVSALKFHRASMKQQQQQEHQAHLQLLHPPAAAAAAAAAAPLQAQSQSQSLPFVCDLSNHMFVVPPTNTHDFSFSFPLPNQTLGLNLNYQDFTNFKIASSSSSSSSTTTDEVHSDSHFVVSQPDIVNEIKSMGGDDTKNLVTSAWLTTEEAQTSPIEFELGNADEHLFTEFPEIPSWLNPTDCYLQQHVNTACPQPQDSSPDPCMDLGEIEALDADWLA